MALSEVLGTGDIDMELDSRIETMHVIHTTLHGAEHEAAAGKLKAAGVTLREYCDDPIRESCFPHSLLYRSRIAVPMADVVRARKILGMKDGTAQRLVLSGAMAVIVSETVEGCGDCGNSPCSCFRCVECGDKFRNKSDLNRDGICEACVSEYDRDARTEVKAFLDFRRGWADVSYGESA